WAEICDRKHTVEDYQQILTWVRGACGWACDPGPCDGVVGRRTRTAIRTFQHRYNQDRSRVLAVDHPAIPEDGVVHKETWEAFFDVYMWNLQLVMRVDHDGLAAKQRALKFVNAQRSVGCGESHPLSKNAIANRKSRIDRRVEIIFFAP